MGPKESRRRADLTVPRSVRMEASSRWSREPERVARSGAPLPEEVHHETHLVGNGPAPHPLGGRRRRPRFEEVADGTTRSAQEGEQGRRGRLLRGRQSAAGHARRGKEGRRTLEGVRQGTGRALSGRCRSGEGRPEVGRRVRCVGMGADDPAVSLPAGGETGAGTGDRAPRREPEGRQARRLRGRHSAARGGLARRGGRPLQSSGREEP